MARGQKKQQTKRSFTARLEPSLLERLEEQSRRSGQTRSQLTARLLDEGLRMDAFPGVVFRPGPTGRRAALVDGPDVWELVRELRKAGTEGLADPAQATAEALSLRREQVELAAAYYNAFPEEVEERIRLNEEAADRVRRAIEGVTA